MASSGLRHIVPEPVRRTPADLALVALYVVVTGVVVFLPSSSETVPRIVLGAPFVLFVPGYAFVALLFPGRPATSEVESSASDDATASGLPSTGIDGIERFTLSVVTSIATVILAGLLLEVSPWRIGLDTVFTTVALFTLVTTVAAAGRRRRLPPEDRFRAPLGSWYRTARDGLVTPETRVDGLLNVAIVLALVVAVWGIGYATADPNSGQFTELYVLTEQPDGDVAAHNYPTNLSVGNSTTFVVAVSNHEHERVRYTLVTELQRIGPADGGARVLQERRVRQTSIVLAHNGTRQVESSVTLREAGRYRLNYLLYRGTLPENPTLDNAYREVHLWMNASASG